MGSTQVVVRGTLQADGSLRLDETPDLPPGPVVVTLRAVAEPVPGEPSWWETLQRIRREQEARGHRPRSREEIDAEMREMRREWEERDRMIDELQAMRYAPPSGKAGDRPAEGDG